MTDRRSRFHWWHEVVLCGLLVALMLIAGYLMPGFLTVRSQLFLSRHLWEFAILATGMTLIIISGGIDLSIGSAMGLCAVMFGICFQVTGSLPVAAAVCLLTGLLGGLFNGFLIARFRLHPLIVTLATYAAFRGIAEGVSQGASYSRFGDQFSQLARGLGRMSLFPDSFLQYWPSRRPYSCGEHRPVDSSTQSVTIRRPRGFLVCLWIEFEFVSMPGPACWQV